MHETVAELENGPGWEINVGRESSNGFERQASVSPGPVQHLQIVRGTDQGPFSFDRFQSSRRPSPEPRALLDHSENPFNDCLSPRQLLPVLFDTEFLMVVEQFCMTGGIFKRVFELVGASPYGDSHTNPTHS